MPRSKRLDRRRVDLRTYHVIALAALAVAPFLQGAAQERGEIIGDDMYVNCQYRVAAHFPSEPKFRDITYRDGALSAPARQFYVEQGMARLSVTVVNFADGPDKDSKLVDNAVAALGQRGQMRFNYPVWYDEPNIGGRQIQVALMDGRALRGSVYMADHRLYITEAIADLNDFPAFLFEQSVSLINEDGVDLDGNPVGLATSAVGTSAGLPNRQYDCSRINRRR
jgi:hypothetical protein